LKNFGVSRTFYRATLFGTFDKSLPAQNGLSSARMSLPGALSVATDSNDHVVVVWLTGRVTQLQMDHHKRSLEETLAYTIAIGRFESAFEACEQLHHDDRRLLLLEAIAKRIIKCQLPDIAKCFELHDGRFSATAA
jgi:hypothetical protein